ncbi:Mitochondrial sodium/calcium exchanger protein [Araneus ventricosus]|uniref:Mitochondrial sodium/calcium exchanger protein n=1 Tax=Araneus ventricosus TaxID=182803 RepID=A0A4Y2R2Y3_ARAVE|nr:Mitochondrial sodium/calcium exchanger protein [Araneus ventricosus]
MPKILSPVQKATNPQKMLHLLWLRGRYTESGRQAILENHIFAWQLCMSVHVCPAHTISTRANTVCTEIHGLNVSMQCLFATTVEDCVEIIEYLDYNYYIFCSLTVDRITLGTTSLVIWLAMLFIALGVTSNYFLCPALFTISNHLGLSQNVAGVTLLAFGNGSPDIFSSAAGLQKASAELAIASLVGAGMFVTSVVAGSVFFTQNFTLMIRPFLRDIAFYIIAISWTFALFSTGTSYLYHGIGFVALYFMYIIVVLGSRFIYLNRQKQKEKEKDQEKDDEKREPEEKKKESKAENPEKSSANSDIIVDKITYDNDPEATAVVLKAFYFGGFEWVDGGRRLSKAHIRLDERRRSRQNSIFSVDGSIASNEKNDHPTSSQQNIEKDAWFAIAKLRYCYSGAEVLSYNLCGQAYYFVDRSVILLQEELQQIKVSNRTFVYFDLISKIGSPWAWILSQPVQVEWSQSLHIGIPIPFFFANYK